ncbi:MAG: hypothetical protein QXM75_00950 [Candidatus Diapherotrites archaeon]
MELTIQNFTPKDARINVISKDANVDTIFYFVPANTNVKKRLFLNTLKSEAEVIFYADLGKCGNQTKKLNVINTGYKNMEKLATKESLSEFRDSASIIETPIELPKIQIYYSLGETNDKIYADVSLRNMSSYNIAGTLFADVPPGFKTTTSSVLLRPLEEKSYRIWIEPNSSASGNFEFEIVFALADLSFRERVNFELKDKPFFISFLRSFLLAI